MDNMYTESHNIILFQKIWTYSFFNISSDNIFHNNPDGTLIAIILHLVNISNILNCEMVQVFSSSYSAISLNS